MPRCIHNGPSLPNFTRSYPLILFRSRHHHAPFIPSTLHELDLTLAGQSISLLRRPNPPASGGRRHCTELQQNQKQHQVERGAAGVADLREIGWSHALEPFPLTGPRKKRARGIVMVGTGTRTGEVSCDDRREDDGEEGQREAENGEDGRCNVERVQFATLIRLALGSSEGQSEREQRLWVGRV